MIIVASSTNDLRGSVSTAFWITKATFGRKHIYSTLARLSAVSIPQNIPMETQEFTFGISVAVIRSLMFSNRLRLQNIWRWITIVDVPWQKAVSDTPLSSQETRAAFVCVSHFKTKKRGWSRSNNIDLGCAARTKWRLCRVCVTSGDRMQQQKEQHGWNYSPSLTLISMLLVRFNFRLQA